MQKFLHSLGRNFLFVVVATFGVCPESFGFDIDFVKLGWNCRIRVVSERPLDREPKGDVLFLTGFADRADNHGPLFRQITDAGFRVISFDYPSHGETQCWNLNFHDFSTLLTLTEFILHKPKFKSDRPLVLIGWSTGGLMAYRMVQRGYLPSRQITGLVLLAPGIYVRKVPGEQGYVTLESLLSNPTPPHMGPIKPKSPLHYPLFGSTIVLNSVLARAQKVPKLPTLMILGDTELDEYVETKKIIKWYKKIKTKNEHFEAFQCPGSKHELDNEIEPIGKSVRQKIVNFIDGLSVASNTEKLCHRL